MSNEKKTDVNTNSRNQVHTLTIALDAKRTLEVQVEIFDPKSLKVIVRPPPPPIPYWTASFANKLDGKHIVAVNLLYREGLV